jgi:anion-transporting  ArsA/GET3 family ATPase
MIQIGPFALCSEVFKHFSDPSSVDMTLFLKEIDAVKTTSQKLQLIEELISKVLNQDIIKEMRERNFFTSPGIEEMALLLVESMPEIFQHQPD